MVSGYRLLAAKYVRKQAKQLRAQFDGICAAEDIEFVHRARVASRRLRAAIRIFGECFNCKQVKRWKKAIRRIRSELGEGRDKDVQIELIGEILDSLSDKTCFAGISRLLVEWEYQRERLQSNVVRAVNRLQRNGTLKELENAAKRLLVKAESHKVHMQSPESFVRAEQEILGRLDEFLALQDCLGRSEDRQSHHAMRIAAKRLRYTLEIAQPIYSGRLDPILESIKQVQTLLGEVHDCDVWQEQLDRFAKAERDRIKYHYGHAGPFARLNAGIEYLRQDRLRRRLQCFENLVRLWDDLNAREIWENLVSVVQSHGEPIEVSDRSTDEENGDESSETQKELLADREDPMNEANGDSVQQASSEVLPPCDLTSGKHAKQHHRPLRRAPMVP